MKFCLLVLFPQLDQSEESDDDDDGGGGERNKQDSGKKGTTKSRRYIPPKIAPMHYGKTFRFMTGSVFGHRHGMNVEHHKARKIEKKKN